MPLLVFLFLALVCCSRVGAAHAQDLHDADTIVRRANLATYYTGNDGRALTKLTIVDAQGRERIRQFTILRRDHEHGGDQDFALLFSYPADVRGMVFLVHKHIAQPDDRWLYLPGLDLVKRIAAGDGRTSFVGSDFVYEDVSGRALNADRHELIETTNAHYIVRNTPFVPDAVAFASWTVWIDKATFLPMKMEYVDRAGDIYRRIETLAVETIAGFPTATKLKASDLRTGGYTISEMRNVVYDLGLPEQTFTERTLRNPSRRWFSTRD